jgi:hypothetical protein
MRVEEIRKNGRRICKRESDGRSTRPILRGRKSIIFIEDSHASPSRPCLKAV